MKFKRLICLALSAAAIGGLVSCGGSSNEKTSGYTCSSADEKYDLSIGSDGTACIYNHGDTKTALKEGFVKIREENSALTLSFDYDVVDVTETKLHYAFNLDINGASASFKIHRGSLLKGLGQDGVIYNTAYDDEGTDGVGMMGASLLFWNSKIDVKVLKIQCNWSYTYTLDKGLSVYVNESQAKMSSASAARNADGVNWDITYDLFGCTLPPFASGAAKSTLTVEDAALKSALLLA